MTTFQSAYIAGALAAILAVLAPSLLDALALQAIIIGVAFIVSAFTE